ncbi:MAG: NAD(P)-dependent oxidoreductase [Desulfarculus sp.]|nr:MAG: NAD(P)-dependent oxidoreductase [Desulfarculus sp.]
MINTVGVLGLGIMGSALARNLLEAGFSVAGFRRRSERLAELKAMGGRPVDSAAELARVSDVVISVLPSVESAQEAILGPKGVAAGAHEGLILVEASTLPLAAKLALRDGLAAAGVTALDCPLSGTGAQAKTKDLAVYASGERAAYEACIPVFEGFARAHHFLGEYGTGSKMKFVANLLVAIHNVSTAEAMVLGMKAGLNPQMIYEVVRSGGGNSRMFEVRGPLMVKGQYQPAYMKMEVWQKDLQIIGDFGREVGAPLPLFSAAVQLYARALASGMASEDTAAVCAVLEQMAGFQRP